MKRYLIIRDRYGRITDYMEVSDRRAEKYTAEEGYTKEVTTDRYKKKWDKWWKE